MFNITEKSISVAEDQMCVPKLKDQKRSDDHNKEKQLKKKIRDRFIKMKTKTYGYIATDCNIPLSPLNSSNLPILVDEETRKIILILKNNASVCLDSINPNIIRRIIMDSGYEGYDVNIKNEEATPLK